MATSRQSPGDAPGLTSRDLLGPGGTPRRPRAPSTDDARLIVAVRAQLGNITASALAERMGVGAAQFSRANKKEHPLPDGRRAELERMRDAPEGTVILTDLEIEALQAMAVGAAVPQIRRSSQVALFFDGLLDKSGALTPAGRAFARVP